VKKPLAPVALVVLLTIWVVACRRQEQKSAGPVAAPDFSLTDLSGDNIHLSSYRGKVVLLDFCATWCEPCKTEIPHFIDMQNRYAAQGLQVIGISMDDEQKAVRDFQQQFKMNYPVAIGNANLAESYGGILGLPITFVIDRQGRIYKRHIGQTEPSLFEDEIRKLLAER
jgi:peroxiredoxin